MSALTRACMKIWKCSGRLGKSSVRKLPYCLDASPYVTHPELSSHARTHGKTSMIKPVYRIKKMDAQNLNVRPQKISKLGGRDDNDCVLIDKTCQRPVSSVDICTLLKISKSPSLRLSAATFLHNELQVRFAHQAKHLGNLPMHLLKSVPIDRANQWYRSMFRKVYSCCVPQNSTDLEAFSAFLEMILLNQKKLSWSIIEDLDTQRKRKKLQMSEVAILDGILNSLLHSLIGTQLLIEHYLATGRGDSMVDPHCSPVNVALSAAKYVKSQFTYGSGPSIAPDIIIHGDAESSFAYVPSHLSLILEEVFSNAVMSYMRHNDCKMNVEPVHVYVCRGKEDVAVKVVDEGGGIKRSSLPLVWSYFYSTCSTIEGGKDESREKSPPLRNRFGKTLQGSGMGLPLARLYSCYFGGDLTLKSMEGAGTTVCCHLHAIQENCSEQIEPTIDIHSL